MDRINHFVVTSPFAVGSLTFQADSKRARTSGYPRLDSQANYSRIAPWSLAPAHYCAHAMGKRPCPFACNCAVTSSRLEMGWEPSDPMLCCVMPMAQRMQTPSRFGNQMSDLLERLDGQTSPFRPQTPS